MVRKQLSINELPEEVIAEILKRLQVKYILRCMCVQKSWYHLIKSPVFITLHLEHQRITTHKYLFFDNLYADTLTVRFDDVQCDEYCKFRYLPGLPMSPFWYMISNGLMCVSRHMDDACYTRDPDIYLWNPLVQKFKTLNPPFTLIKRKWQALAFGFLPQVNDYVVVHFVKLRLASKPDQHSVIIGVFSLKTNSWRTRRYDNVFISRLDICHVVFINGATFWLGVDLEDNYIVMCFDTKTDILRIITLPESKLGDHAIHPLGQSIAYFKYESQDDESEDNEIHYLDVWVLEFDQMNECSWEKKMSVSLSKNTRGHVLGVKNNGEPILARKYNLISYNLDNHEANDIVDSWNYWTPFSCYDLKNDFWPPFSISPFVENLVLLDAEQNN